MAGIAAMRSTLLDKDIQIYARHLVAVTIEEHLASGAFTFDLAFFSEHDQKRIVSELKHMVRRMHSSAGTTLPSEKQSKKEKEAC